MISIWQDAPYLRGSVRKQLTQTKARFDLIGALDNPGKRDRETEKKIEALVSSIYSELGIIDVKVGPLTQASAILFFVASLNLNSDLVLGSQAEPNLIIAGAFMILFVSILLCLSVIFLFWFRFNHKAGHATDNELMKILKIRNSRTRRYRLAWFLTFVGGALIVFSHMQTIFNQFAAA